MKYRFGKTLVMHIFQGILIDYIVHLPCPEEFKKVDPAFALCAFKPGEQLIAYMGTVAIFSIMPYPGIIHVSHNCSRRRGWVTWQWVYGWYPLKVEPGGMNSGAMGIVSWMIISEVLLLLSEPGRFPEGSFLSWSLGVFSNVLGQILGFGFCPLSMISSNCKMIGVFSSSGILGICILCTLIHCIIAP